MDIFKKSQQISGELKETYRLLHKNAETGFELSKTASIVTQKLKEIGVDFDTDGKIIICDIGKKDGEAFLLRADMDALPIAEESGVEFASQNGNCHACGHDMHTAMLLGCARLLKENEDMLQGKVRLLFQPAEEILEGAKYAISKGVLDGVCAGMMLHTMTATPFGTGTAVISSQGITAPSADYFTITIKGRGGHGSSPHNCIDPITATAHLVVALQEILAREVPPSQPTALTIGEIHGGNAHNIIPESVTLKGTVRCFDEKLREFLKCRIEELSQSVAKAFRATSTITYDSGCPSLLNDKSVSEIAYETVEKLLGKEQVFTSDEVSKNSSLSSGSEDFAYISHKIPTVMVALSAGSNADGYEYPLHNPKVKFDEKALPYGTAIYTAIACEYLNKKSGE